MELMSNILLGIGTLALAGYCIILSRKLKKFSDLKGGMARTIYSLSEQMSALEKSVDRSEAATRRSEARLSDLTERAEAAARTLELHIAALHDLPTGPPKAEDETSADRNTRFLRSRGLSA